MHLYFERNDNAKCDCNILSLSWMGKLPDELQEDESWKLYRRKYYQEGWLATGNARGLVGVTFTTSHCKTKAPELPIRANYNLRGHRSEVTLVKWNEPYQKLASCDSTGVIFVWIKFDGRWSIELINDRSTPVTYFSWSHDGRMALICYKDGFVLVGSVAGQRYWSSMLNHKAVITCGIWTPDDQQVYFGTTAGQLIVMDVHGAMVSEIQLDAGVTSMAWSVEKFKLEEDGEEEDEDEDKDEDDRDEDYEGSGSGIDGVPRNYVLAVCLANGQIVLLRSFDDAFAVTINTGLKPPLQAEWSNSRKLLAIAGVKSVDNSNNTYVYTNILKFYSDNGTLLYTIAIPYTQSPVTALTWGHNDRRLFVATGSQVHAAWVSRGVGSLQLLSRLALKTALSKESSVEQLPLPPRLKALVAALFSSTIRCCIPEPRDLRRFVSRPPPVGGRLHCTMLRNPGEPPHSYTLYVEYLGGLVPLLKGRRTSKIRPEFVIFDPESGGVNSPTAECTVQLPSCSDDSDNETDAVELCTGSPRFRRKSKRRYTTYEKANNDDDDANYADTLPEKARLVEVTSNIWGTKFKFHGLADSIPANLGRVTYRTSLLHLQPRQMTLVITELHDDIPRGPDPSFNPNLFSEDEEEFVQPEQSRFQFFPTESQVPPIAPMTPRTSRLNSTTRPKTCQPPVSREEDFSYREPIRVSRTAYVTTPIRHSAPRCCDVPALQSPKNAVAPTQTLIAASSQNASLGEYTSSVQRMKNALVDQQNMVTLKKELEINKMIYVHTVTTSPISGEEKLSNLLTNSSATSQPARLTPCTTNQNYLYSNDMTNSEAAQSILSPQNSIHSKNNLNGLIMRDTISRSSGICSATEKEGIQVQENLALKNQVINIGPPQISENSIVRSCSVGYLDFVDAQIVPCDVALNMLRKDAPNKRLFLYSKKPRRKRRDKDKDEVVVVHRTSKARLNTNGKSRSLDSSELLPSIEQIALPPKLTEYQEEPSISINVEQIEKTTDGKTIINNPEKILASHEISCLPSTKVSSKNSSTASIDIMSSRVDNHGMKLGEFDECYSLPPPSPRPSSRLPRSSPSSPAPSKKGKRPSSASPIRRRLLSSPLLGRKSRKNRHESSDEEGFTNQDDFSNYYNLETFQKAQIRQKLKQRGCGLGYRKEITKREIIMHNKAPMWNEANQVYQLDFGGRVTQESAKNFQIEFRGNQVMQFGRIQGNAYTLDFQYPFSAIQAFAVALASVTQRLK